MKAILKVAIIAKIFLTALVGPQAVEAQGSVTYLSNLEQPSSGTVAVGSDSWIAADFITGNGASGYLLNSIQLAMADASGAASGFTVMVYGGAIVPGGFVPGSSLGTLTGPANPVTGGTYTYAAPSGLALSPGEDYFIVVTAGTKVSIGAYEWNLSEINSYNPSGGWGVTSGVSSIVYGSGNGSSWNSLSATYPEFAINATPTPEPGVVGLFALGGLLVGFRRWKARAQ